MCPITSKPAFVLEERSASSRWREFWSRNEKANDYSCGSANKVLDGTSHFQKQMSKTVNLEEKASPENANEDTLRALLSGCLGDAQGLQDKSEEGRRIIKRVGKKTVVFAKNFQGFLQAYSGIVDIMKAADQQYGGLAYSTLSLLLIVAVNKQQKEEHIDSALLTLQREFARLEILRDVHSSDTMRRYIAEAYRLGIEFAREVTLYYSRPTYRRVLDAITKPPQLGVDLKVAAITEAMTEIKTEKAILDSKRLHEVQQSVDEVQREMNEVKEAVGASQVQNEKMLLNNLKELLLPRGYDLKKILDRYSSDVRGSFKNTGRLSSMDVEQLQEDTNFRDWKDNTAPCIMLLYGRTAIAYTDYSWLSPVFFGLFKLYRDQHRIVILHCCQDRNSTDQYTDIHVVLSNLIYQLLEAKPSILRDRTRYLELEQRFSDPVWRTNPPQMPFAVLGELLNMFPEVYILLDRVDRIKGRADRFIDPLINMIKKSKCIIKIFLVASSNNHAHPDGKITPEVLANAEEELGPDRFSSLRLDQK